MNDEALLYVRITVNKEKLNISLKKKTPIALWDAQKKKAKGNSAIARQINDFSRLKNKNPYKGAFELYLYFFNALRNDYHCYGYLFNLPSKGNNFIIYLFNF
ncbi:Arm DNA-binding domain-containing protein [Lutibacter maritimus]|uniref:Arm DNA-binding domain-containing protein n=1 Tax=Lutibacter maritimus TaxID=593133 RepID=UPI000B7E1D03